MEKCETCGKDVNIITDNLYFDRSPGLEKRKVYCETCGLKKKEEQG